MLLFGIMIAFAAAFFGILGGLLLHKIIGWYIEGAIGGLQCVLVAGLYIGFVLSIVTAKVPIALLLLAVLAAMVVFSKLQERRTIQSLYDEQIEQYREVIASDPLNLAARSRLANVLHEKGRLDEAIAELTEVVRRSPESRPDAYLLEELLEEKEERRAPPITCPSCGHQNPPDRTRCADCEGYLRPSSELKVWLMRGGLRQIAISWAVTMAVVTLMLFGLSMLSLPGRILVIALFLLVVISAGLLHAYRSF